MDAETFEFTASEWMGSKEVRTWTKDSTGKRPVEQAREMADRDRESLDLRITVRNERGYIVYVTHRHN